MKKIGVCKECLADVVMDESTAIDGHPNIWECPDCGYPNCADDFWQIFKTEEEA